MADHEEIGVFTEEQAQLLTGITRHQLARWDRQGFFGPSFEPAKRTPYGRVYSFWDIVALRILNELRNSHRVSLQHLRHVSKALGSVGNRKWADQVLFVFNKRVVVEDKAARKRDLVSDQYLIEAIPLRVVISSTQQAIRDLNRRGEGLVGKITQSRFVDQNAPVIAGTRIRAHAVQKFAEAGYSEDEIIAEYPSLTRADVRSAIDFRHEAAAA